MSKKTDRADVLPGTLDMLILKTLTITPMHGYGIAQHIQQVSREAIQVEEGSLYPSLQRMQVKGWLTSEWGQSPTGRRARYYRLTAAGKKQLGAEVADFRKAIEAIQRVIQAV
ncbi:MAG: PadR family transcriptional regulator [Gemmatimonadota bacterium]|jgi:transcriptional regulator|nr:PadR family transcriptional regulator [Gemmatimonadaceae bacterium]